MAAAVRQLDLIDHRGRRRDQIEIVLARQPLLNDFEVEQPQEAAAEAETERCRCLHFETERGVVEAEFSYRLPQFLEIGGVDGKQPAEQARQSPRLNPSHEYPA